MCENAYSYMQKQLNAARVGTLETRSGNVASSLQIISQWFVSLGEFVSDSVNCSAKNELAPVPAGNPDHNQTAFA
jgi:hypothetical protein